MTSHARELRPGLWHWQAPHPEWSEGEEWPQDVSSYALDDGAHLLLCDPLEVPEELLELTRDRTAAIVLTAPWHERDTRALVERLGLPVYTPPPDTADDLVQKYGLTRKQAGNGSPDLAWLLASNHERQLYLAGDLLPFGIRALPGREHNDLVLWVEDRNAVVAGDTLADFGTGIEIQEQWLRAGVTRESVAEGLRPLLDLPVELLLPAHGSPSDRAALERALA
jgi:glyoxylase-like metal-dependent hydrolase (beta-lactamase superfamily II)